MGTDGRLVKYIGNLSLMSNFKLRRILKDKDRPVNRRNYAYAELLRRQRG